MGNLCVPIPNIRLSCGNDNVNSSCCKWISLASGNRTIDEQKERGQYLYAWTCFIRDDEGQTEIFKSKTLHADFYLCNMDALEEIKQNTAGDCVYDVELCIRELKIQKPKSSSIIYCGRWKMSLSKPI